MYVYIQKRGFHLIIYKFPAFSLDYSKIFFSTNFVLRMTNTTKQIKSIKSNIFPSQYLLMKYCHNIVYIMSLNYE